MACAAHCTPAAPSATPSPALTPTPTLRVEPDADAATSNPIDSGAVVVAADAAPKAALGTTPDRFRCGISSCRVGEETCCLAGNEGVCLRSSPNDAPHGQIGYLKTQFEACNAAELPHGYSLSGIERCDESIDCDKGQVCCDQFLFSGGTISECVALPPKGNTPCDFGERCIQSATCRMPGTTCIEGYCRKATIVRCGGVTCDSGQVCCGDPSGCVAKASCQSHHRVLCASDGDCVKGERCTVMGAGANCLNLMQDALSQQLVCRSDADCKIVQCPAVTPGAPPAGARARCRTSAVAWLKSCQCPEP